MPDCDALNDVQPCGCAFKKINSGKVVSRHDLGEWGSLMYYIALDLDLKGAIRLDLTGIIERIASFSGGPGWSQDVVYSSNGVRSEVVCSRPPESFLFLLLCVTPISVENSEK